MDKKILFILMPQDFQDFEFIEPYNALVSQGYKVDVAGFTEEEASGALGKVFHTPNKLLDAMNDEEFDYYDALIIPGGPGCPTYLWNNENIQDIVCKINANNALIATICHASIVPAQAGILTGKEATTYPTKDAKAIFEECNVSYVDQGCVILHNDRIITSQGPKHAQAFASAILEELSQL